MTLEGGDFSCSLLMAFALLVPKFEHINSKLLMSYSWYLRFCHSHFQKDKFSISITVQYDDRSMSSNFLKFSGIHKQCKVFQS